MDGLLFFSVMDGGKAFGIDNRWMDGKIDRWFGGWIDE